jgi:cyclopropane-fatty-acyl-phospholipid synthase
MNMRAIGIRAAEGGLLPDRLVRGAIRGLCEQRLAAIRSQVGGDPAAYEARFVESMNQAPIALVPEAANEQHYEIPSEFFGLVLGRHRKYSSCLWQLHCRSLDSAEEAALETTCQHAQLQDGQEVLELGCGWGSLSLWMAEKYPQSRITAVSNSASQREYILGEAQRRGLQNLTVVTADMNLFDPMQLPRGGRRFDRIVSVEMFEHMRNYRLLLSRIAGWLTPRGKVFIHIFCHRETPYLFEPAGPSDWMARYFFAGGMMPNAGLLRNFNNDFTIAEQWTWNGLHYQKTADAWLAQLDLNKKAAIRVLSDVYGSSNALIWLNRWRMFFMSVSELFGYSGGNEWYVSHYLLEHKGS